MQDEKRKTVPGPQGNPQRPLAPAAFALEETYRATRLPVDQASTLIPDAYTSSEFHALELERVFARSWVPVCVTDEVAEPGRYVVVEVAGRSLIVCRNREGELRAHHNVCRHRGTRLCEAETGTVERFFQCPYHAWAYDLDGVLLGTPLFTLEAGIPVDQEDAFDISGVRSFDKADYGLHPVRVESWGCLVFVCLDDEVSPLSEELGDLPERLAGYRLAEQRLLRRVEYEIAANWKLVGENFMEYYHLPWVHPGLVRVSPLKAHHRWQGTGMYIGFCTSLIAANTDDGGWQGLPALSTLDEDDASSARFAWLFPNVALNALPNHTFLMLTRPTAAGWTKEVTYLLSHPESIAGAGESIEEEAAALLAFWDEVNREDIAIVERVQQGVIDPAYTGGRMCYRFEEPVHRFQNMVIDRMLGLRRVPAGDALQQQPMFPVVG
ncbi:MAG: aromatic ring-hydroxylating dioxygenase subunit alpha [Actinobacteria bacterium]|nr:aromatic ring-hydroxylating dioxygenase subunit alpha [Actinomycetota bacterium]